MQVVGVTGMREEEQPSERVMIVKEERGEAAIERGENRREKDQGTCTHRSAGYRAPGRPSGQSLGLSRPSGRRGRHGPDATVEFAAPRSPNVPRGGPTLPGTVLRRIGPPTVPL